MAAADTGSINPRLRAWTATALLCFTTALIIAGLALIGPSPKDAPMGVRSDRDLYQDIVQAMAQGRSYYVAAPAALRANGYPLKPFIAVRPPELASALALLPNVAMRRGALEALAALTMGAWAWRLRGLWQAQPIRYVGALILLASGLYPVTGGWAYLFHEVWAGQLIALSLALYRPGRWRLSLALGLAAALIRELAIPFLAVMAVAAWWEDRKSEALAWVLAGVAAIAALTAHALAVQAINTPTDLHSSGWVHLGGWGFVLTATKGNMFLYLVPRWWIAIAVPLALLGLLFPKDGVGLRAAVIVWGFSAGLCVVGRPDNIYWGLMIAPLWPLGLARLDEVLKILIGRSRQLFHQRPSGATSAVAGR